MNTSGDEYRGDLGRSAEISLTAADLLFDADDVPSVAARGVVGSPLRPAVWALVGLAALKVLVALVALVVAPSMPRTVRHISTAQVVLQLLTYGGAGAVLLLAHARDVRTARLGAVLLIVASAFSTGQVAAFAAHYSVLTWLSPLYPDAWLPVLLTQFVEEFPRRSPESFAAQALRVLRRLATVAGAGLFAVNALVAWGPLATMPWAVALVRRSDGGTAYWTVVFALLLVLVPLALDTRRIPDAEERRRVHWFWLCFWLGIGPTVVIVVLTALPLVGSWFTAWMVRPAFLWGFEISLATVPVTVAYTILVRQMLPLRVVLRQTAQYLLARWAVTAAILIPILLLAVEGYRHRDETVAAVFAGHAVPWLVVAGAATVLLVSRETILRWIDRVFLRDVRDTREVLVTVASQARQARRIDELVAVLTSAIDRAFRPDLVAVLIKDRAGDLVSVFGSVEPLPAGSLIVSLLQAASAPVDARVDTGGVTRWLPRHERQWLVDSRSRLLVPLRAAEGDLMGVITVSDRRSELPFSREDRDLLSAIADAGASTLEYHAVQTPAGPDGSVARESFWTLEPPTVTQAGECVGCGQVESGGDRPCDRCGSRLQPAAIPHMMFGKFRFDERVGRGGLGIVYKATDLALDRPVAIKTLPGTSPEDSERLRREAKAMAAVVHHNLAVVYGAESWRGRPMLICEFMSHGTLAQRLAQGPQPYEDVLSLGIALAEALHVIHHVGLLHRDIKPSNIGFAADGVAKLLDFGLVHLLPQSPSSARASLDDIADEPTLLGLSVTRPLIGTPLYLSPEAIRGQRPNVAFDLWSLNVLLCEAAVGRHPFLGGTVRDTLDRIQAADVSVALGQSPIARTPMAPYLGRALARDPGVRPQTALEIVTGLRALQHA